MKYLIILLTVFTLNASAHHGDSLASFNGITAFDNNTKISRNSALVERYGSFECTEYIERYYREVHNVNIRDYIPPSYSYNGWDVYLAKDMYRSKYNGKSSSDGKLSFFKNPILKKGDIIVYDGDFSGHVAIYIGGGKEIGQNIKPTIRQVSKFKGIIRYNDTLTKDNNR